jgi:hypothetical protein
MSTAEGIPLTAGMPTTLETPSIVLASTGRPTATEMPQTVWMLTTNEFFVEIGEKFIRTATIHEKRRKRTKIAHF